LKTKIITFETDTNSFFLFFQIIILSAQNDVEFDYVSTELPVEPWKASLPKESLPLGILNHIDTIRSGLY
jgi:hypothetical protein